MSPVSIKGKGAKQQNTKIPNITLRPIPLHAHFEKVLALPRDCVTLQRNLAYFSPITDTRQPEKTQCFTRIPALQSHACCSTQAYQQWLAQCCRPFDSLLHSTLLKSTCSTLLISTLRTSSHLFSHHLFLLLLSASRQEPQEVMWVGGSVRLGWCEVEVMWDNDWGWGHARWR